MYEVKLLHVLFIIISIVRHNLLHLYENVQFSTRRGFPMGPLIYLSVASHAFSFQLTRKSELNIKH